MGEHFIDHQWNAIAAKAKHLIPDDPDEDKIINERYHDIQESPRGCSITASGELWRAKMYLGGKQRVLGYGTGSQMARLYDVCLWRFRRYRTDKPFAVIYNYSEERAGDDNLHPDIQIVPCDFEELLLARKLIFLPEEQEQRRVQAKQDSRHKYTKSGRMEELLLVVSENTDKLIDRVTALEKEIQKLTLRQPGDVVFVPHDIPTLPKFSDGPGYTAPSIGDPLNQPVVTCKAPESV